MIRAIISIIAMQVAVAFGVAALFLLLKDWVSAKSALIGGAIAFIPGAFYALRLIRSRHSAPDRLLRAHYFGEFGKLMLTVLLFGATFAWVREISVLPLFADYIATLLVYWAALVMFSRI
ncbi:MAG TPA: ATP synthase subunit I [Burkholderiales bacterium]|nr:ATP synthase subunit I [Burkholderiales bacterium]